MSADAPAAEDGTGYLAALRRYRETSRWVLTALGASAIAVIAGFGLADFGKVTGANPLRLGLACGGIVLATLGFLGCLAQALRLATESWTEAADLVALPPDDPIRRVLDRPANGLLAGYSSFADLSQAHTEALSIWRRNERLWFEEADESGQELAGQWRDRAVELESSVRLATLAAATTKLRRQFVTSSRRLVGFAACGVLGIVMFAWAVTEKGPPALIGDPPSKAALEVATPARERLRPLLGDDCGLDAVPVIVLSSEATQPPQVVVYGERCRTVILSVDDGTGRLLR